MTTQRKNYTNEFKLEVIHLVTEQGYLIRQAADAMSVGKSTLDKWVRQYCQEKQGISPVSAKALTTDQREIQHLRKVYALLAQDNLKTFR